MKVEVNWFDNRFRDLIEFQVTNFQTFSGTFFNLNRTKAQGAELIFEAAPLSSLRLTASYTYLNAEITNSNVPSDLVFGDKKQLLRRPRHRSEEHTSELQSHSDLVCRLLLEKKKKHR